MTDNIDRDEIRKAIDRLQLEHPVHFAYDATRIVEPSMAKAVQDDIDRVAKSMVKDATIHIICEMAKLYLDGVKPTIETKKSYAEWIPCSERLPEVGQIVIVTDDRGKVYEYELNPLYVDKYTTGKWRFLEHEILAWMPLPKPYKEGDPDV